MDLDEIDVLEDLQAPHPCRLTGACDGRPSHASHIVGRAASSYRQGERAAILGVGLVQIRASVERLCLLVRYPDGQGGAVLLEGITSGIYTLETS